MPLTLGNTVELKSLESPCLRSSIMGIMILVPSNQIQRYYSNLRPDQYPTSN
jgi:hypothetical protein